MRIAGRIVYVPILQYIILTVERIQDRSGERESNVDKLQEYVRMSRLYMDDASDDDVLDDR